MNTMEPNHELYAGMEISSGRRPLTLAVLDGDLHVAAVERCMVPEAISLLDGYGDVQLAISVPGSRSGRAIFSELKRKLKSAGYTTSSHNENNPQWIETAAQECFRAFRSRLFPRRNIEGRIQRALILYEEGIQIQDPMDFFEEITRHKLLQGNLPDENIHSMKQLDALIAAYIAWLAVHRPHRVETRGDLVLPTVMAHV